MKQNHIIKKCATDVWVCLQPTMSVVIHQIGGAWQNLVGITEQSQGGQGKDGSRAVRVDGDDGLCFAHSAGMLSRAGDAAGDVEARMYVSACRADLPRVFHPAAISRHTGCSHRRAEQAREGGNLCESLAPDAAPTRDDAFGGLQFDILRRWGL